MGKRLSKRYTRTGDDGSTGMADGRRVKKSDIIFEVMGDIDELNAHIGMMRALLSQQTEQHNSAQNNAQNTGKTNKQNTDFESCEQTLSIIQHLLFNVGGELSMPEYKAVLAPHLKWLENDIDAMNQTMPALKDFILPAGGQLTCQTHIARTVCRRAERHAALLNQTHDNALSSDTYQFINRLSDWLFVFARFSTRQESNTSNNEVLWDKNVLLNL